MQCSRSCVGRVDEDMWAGNGGHSEPIRFLIVLQPLWVKSDSIVYESFLDCSAAVCLTSLIDLTAA